MATMPVTGYCTFHITRESRWSAAERYGYKFGRDACPARLAGRPSSRWCIADSRHPPPEPDDAVHRAAAVPPIQDPVGIPSQGQPGPFSRCDFIPRSFAAAANRRNAATAAKRQTRAAPAWARRARLVALRTRGEFSQTSDMDRSLPPSRRRPVVSGRRYVRRGRA